MANRKKNIEQYPFYLRSHENGLLSRRVRESEQMLASCNLCPRNCGVNRLDGELGFCRIGSKAQVASHGPHFGEESPLVGNSGSGTIFFAGCNLGCVFCQNEDISNIDDCGDHAAEAVSAQQLAAMMLELQEQGCLNINLVTPSHVVPQILAALDIAASQGLHLPLVYNSSGYDRVSTLQLLEGIVDIYMPDCKFMAHKTAARYTGVADYPVIMQAALCEMARQVGDLVLNENGIALRGLLVRHLVMPGCLADTERVVTFLAEEISKDTWINIMDQYRPCFRADEFAEINRPLNRSEHEQGMQMACDAGLHRFDERDMERMIRLLLSQK